MRRWRKLCAAGLVTLSCVPVWFLALAVGIGQNEASREPAGQAESATLWTPPEPARTASGRIGVSVGQGGDVALAVILAQMIRVAARNRAAE